MSLPCLELPSHFSGVLHIAPPENTHFLLCFFFFFGGGGGVRGFPGFSVGNHRKTPLFGQFAPSFSGFPV